MADSINTNEKPKDTQRIMLGKTALYVEGRKDKVHVFKLL